MKRKQTDGSRFQGRSTKRNEGAETWDAWHHLADLHRVLFGPCLRWVGGFFESGSAIHGWTLLIFGWLKPELLAFWLANPLGGVALRNYAANRFGRASIFSGMATVLSVGFLAVEVALNDRQIHFWQPMNDHRSLVVLQIGALLWPISFFALFIASMTLAKISRTNGETPPRNNA